MVEKERVKKSEKLPNISGEYVAYWVQSSPRIEYNPSLEYAKEMCEKFNKPLFIFSVLNPDYPSAKRRAYEFFLGGLKDFKISLKNIDLEYSILLGNPKDIVLEISRNAVLIVTDKGYLNYSRDLNESVKNESSLLFVEIEGNIVVPVEEASNKEEYGAYTIRKKITSRVEKFIKNPRDEFREKNFKVMSYLYIDESFTEKFIYNNNYRKKYRKNIDLKIIDVENINECENFLSSIEDDNHYPLEIIPGEKEAKKLLDLFIEEKLKVYSLYSNHPIESFHSGLSPYLHYGQISPMYIYNKVKEFQDKQEKIYFSKNTAVEKEGLETVQNSVDNFLEELIVRRELAFNFCYFNRDYENFNKILSNWTYTTLEEHRTDKRDYVYSLNQLEKWETHDNYWNQVQKELVTKGTMNSYMRMYWGKKILEWSVDAETAYRTAIYLNNRYFLDGRDPNSFAGVAWCFGKHDRPWGERGIFGKVRYMNETGIIRKSKVKIVKLK